MFFFTHTLCHNDNAINTPLNRPVNTSGIWYALLRSIISANHPIAQNAPCSRYLKCDNVFFSTNMRVNDLTNIAPIPSPNAIITIFFVSANAPITPSNEKLASRISRYKNVPNHPVSHLWRVQFDSPDCNKLLSPDITR